MSEAFDLIAFRDFCAGKGDEAYRFTDHNNCALAQFLRERGYAADPRVGAFDWYDGEMNKDTVPHVFSDDVGHALCRRPDTFSALASRLSNLIGEGGNG